MRKINRPFWIQESAPNTHPGYCSLCGETYVRPGEVKLALIKWGFGPTDWTRTHVECAEASHLLRSQEAVEAILNGEPSPRETEETLTRLQVRKALRWSDEKISGWEQALGGWQSGPKRPWQFPREKLHEFIDAQLDRYGDDR